MSIGSKLSPKLRKALFKTAGATLVRALVEIAPGTDEDALARELTSLGAEIRSRLSQSHLWTIDIPVNRLESLETVKGIIYVEGGEQYRH